MWQPYLHLRCDIIPPSAICLYQLLSAGCDCRDLVYASSLLCYSYWRTDSVRLFSCAANGNQEHILPLLSPLSPCCLFCLILECPYTLSDWRITNCFVMRRYIVHWDTGRGSGREKKLGKDRETLSEDAVWPKKKRASSTYWGLITAQGFRENVFFKAVGSTGRGEVEYKNDWCSDHSSLKVLSFPYPTIQ